MIILEISLWDHDDPTAISSGIVTPVVPHDRRSKQVVVSRIINIKLFPHSGM